MKPPPVTGLAYVILDVTDMDNWCELLGMLGVNVTKDADVATVRIDSRRMRWELRAADTDRLVALGWEMLDDTDVEAWAGMTPGAKVDDPSDRRCGALAWVEGPGDVRHEVIARPQRTTEPLTTPTGARFVAESLGAGHAVLVLEQLDEMIDFARSVLGLRLSDTITRKDRTVTFMHCQGGPTRHHSLALTRGAGPTQLNHLMFEVTEMNMVGRAYERCERAGLISRSIGEHTNDKMFSFYCRTPSGFEIEYGWGGTVIDNATWRPVDHPASSIWGHVKQ